MRKIFETGELHELFQCRFTASAEENGDIIRQSFLLRSLCSKKNISAIVRKYYTKPQKELGHKERKKNLQHAFERRKVWKEPQKILVIDDIYTTGSTIDEISRIFCEKSNNKVWFLTISIGQDF